MEIRINISGQKNQIFVSDMPISFIDVMKQMGISFMRPCMGKLRCLSCGINFEYGAPKPNDGDLQAFSKEELEEGHRLGCKCVIDQDCCIDVPLALTGKIQSPEMDKENKSIEAIDSKLAIAIDIGTTTLAFAVVDTATGHVLNQSTCTNSQVQYGSDVMTRIEAALNGESQKLAQCVREDIAREIEKLAGKTAVPYQLIIGANTTMTQLYMGESVEGLASFPFKPFSLKARKLKSGDADIFVMPQISAFIGGDIVSGLYAIREKMEQGINLFVDFGTNAEIVLFDGSKYQATSASCGPALEGGNLRCGVPSVSGAINHIRIVDGGCQITTIDNARPVGLCGSGVIDLIAELRRNDIIDAGGLLVDEYAENGYPISGDLVITGEDIQQVLLAKSAICAGIKVLLSKANITLEMVDTLYAAGGLGTAIDSNSAAYIGLIPIELKDKYVSCGNLSLQGLIRFASERDEEALEYLKSKTCVHEMGNTAEFETLFLENLFL